MKSAVTGIDVQRADFVENLYKQIRKQTEVVIAKHDKLCRLAASYLTDGCTPSECIELLILDGKITREAAHGYIAMAQSEGLIADSSDGLGEYSFKFEDANGQIWSSYDIGKTVHASSQTEASEKAEEIVLTETNLEPERIFSVSRIS